jgi:hypothetical protein
MSRRKCAYFHVKYRIESDFVFPETFLALSSTSSINTAVHLVLRVYWNKCVIKYPFLLKKRAT